MSRAEALWLSAGGALCLLCCNAVPFGHYIDDVVWVLLARGFVHGSVMASWSFTPRLETTATWGFAALLTPVAALTTSALALKAWSAALWFSGAGLFYAAVRERLGAPARRAYLAGLLFSGYFIGFAGNVVSEAGYSLLFGAAAFLALEKDWLRRGGFARIAALGFLSGFLTMTRLIGAALALALGLALARRRRFKETAIFAAAGAAAAAPYALALALARGGYADYHVWALGQGALSALRGGGLFSRAWFYLKGLSLLTFVYFPSFLPNAAWLKGAAAAAILAIAAVGARRSCGDERGRCLVVYAALYGAVVCSWPFEAPRFVAPLYPVFLLFFCAGLEVLAAARARAAFAVVSVLILATNAGELWRTARASLTQPPEVAHQSQLWLRDHTSPDEPVISMDVARIAYFAGRRGVHFLPSDSAASFAAAARSLGARYVFLKQEAYVPTPGWADPLKAQYARLEAYAGDAEFFEPVYRNPEESVVVYELKREKR